MMLRRPLVLGLLLGAVAGVLVLGIGGRVLMRAYALATGRPPAFSVTGTARLLLVATLAGGVMGVVFAWLRQRLTSWPALTVGLALGLAVFAVLLPGMKPPGPGGTLLSLLPFLGYGVFVDGVWQLLARH